MPFYKYLEDKFKVLIQIPPRLSPGDKWRKVMMRVGGKHMIYYSKTMRQIMGIFGLPKKGILAPFALFMTFRHFDLLICIF